jgi:hypothetical protein
MPDGGYLPAMMTMLGAMTTTSVLITAEAVSAARGAAAAMLGAGQPTSRSWLHPADDRSGDRARHAA